MTPPEDSLPPTELAAAPPLFSRKTSILLGVIATLIVALFGVGFWLGKQPVPLAKATATPSPAIVVQITSTTITPLPVPGWEAAGPPWAQNIAFAPSDPQTEYACGAGDNSFQSKSMWPMQVGVSRDTGATWQIANPGAVGNECYVRVSSANANDAVLAVDSIECPACPGITLYRTLDGGQTWTQLSLPPQGSTITTQFSGYAWAGMNLFVTPYVTPGDQPQRYLAVSHNGGPFTWVNTARLFNGVAPTIINQVIGVGDTLVAVYTQSSCGECQEIARSSDGGATWTHTTPLDGTNPIAIIGGGTAPETLYGAAVAQGLLRLERSTDLGHSWRQLPQIPPFLNQTFVFDTPDGTIYGVFANGIYALVSGSAQWVVEARLPASNLLLAVQSDSQGHPLALWALAGFNANVSGTQLPGLVRHGI